ncbi:restriction endonuclease subunit S [uncultured Fibrobacter sp.]|uniref:restriction endonuclease subunit S n=1 Tax=uncultured Fibrobacter sp. TaxID=261512 RepID=UPI0028055CF4|nr:restriction endonuclease subunit S [uncultured Fibrobacter sp.]
MSFADDVKIIQYVYGFAKVRLCDIATIERGKRIVKAETKKDGKYQVYGGSLKPMGFLDSYNFTGDKVLVINKGNAGDVGYSRGKFFAAESCFVITPSELAIPRYLYHFLCANVGEIKRRVCGQPHGLKIGDLENLCVFLPPLEKQIEIVNRLNVAESYLAWGQIK